jgi:hypothetical protein
MARALIIVEGDIGEIMSQHNEGIVCSHVTAKMKVNPDFSVPWKCELNPQAGIEKTLKEEYIVKKLLSVVIALALVFALTATAFAQTQKFYFALTVGTSGDNTRFKATKAGGSAFANKAYFTVVRKIKVGSSTYRSTLVSGDLVEFCSRHGDTDATTWSPAVSHYDTTVKAQYKSNMAVANREYTLAASIPEDSRNYQFKIVGKWTP